MKYTLPGYELSQDLQRETFGDVVIPEIEPELEPGPGLGQITPLLDRIKVIAWDFDCTITQIGTCYPKILQVDDVNAMDLNKFVSDVPLFRNTVDYLRRFGKRLAIVSYGSKDVIRRTMERIFGPTGSPNNPFTDDTVITPRDVTRELGLNPPWRDCHQPPGGYGKNDMLQILQRRLATRGVPTQNDEIVLIDDSIRNIQAATAAGYYGIIIPPSFCQGFNRHLLEGFDALGDPAPAVSEAEFKQTWNEFYRKYS